MAKVIVSNRISPSENYWNITRKLQVFDEIEGTDRHLGLHEMFQLIFTVNLSSSETKFLKRINSYSQGIYKK